MTLVSMLLILGKVTLVLASGLAAVRLARKSPAAVRHLLLAATFTVAAVAPVASMLAPTIDITLPLPAPAASTSSSGVAGDVIQGAPKQTPGTASRGTIAPGTVPAPSAPLWVFVTIAWLTGTMLVLLPLTIGLRQMHHLRRTGLPWSRGRAVAAAIAGDAALRGRVDVMLHESTPGPLTFGAFRPAIMLPVDAKAWDEDDLNRAIVHEMEHVRRRDWISQRLAHLVCACYWFHPLVWIAWRRFVVEAERACDDAVLRRSEATAYADQLVTLATHLSASRQPLLAMANRADLSTRVAAVLDRNQPRGRAGRASVLFAAVAALMMLVLVSPIRLVAFKQAQVGTLADPKKYRYDVASIKVCETEEVPTGARGTAGGTNATWSPGRFQVPCVTAGQLIYLAYAAYGVGPDEHLINDDSGAAASPLKVRGGPDWVHSLKDKYEVEATAQGATERSVLMGAMLRTLLEERFKLKVHRDTEMVDMLELKVAKGGLKMTPMKEGDCEKMPPGMTPRDMNTTKPLCGNLNMMNASGHVRWTFGGMPLVNLARRLSSQLKIFVIDGTGVKDEFVFKFEFQMEDTASQPDSRIESRGAAGDGQPAPSLNAALEAMGLRLEKVKAPRGFLVIDHIERPTPNGPEPVPPARAAGPGRHR
ncbi:MAG TPA: M56 family metallopeptidase [Vicinamibacterales bacterium]|nr:M56 family metallopeptidase [Vicinamibacterales bacterium]